LTHFSLDLSSGFQSVSLKFDEHFLLHEIRELIGHLIIFFFKNDMIVPEFFEIKVKFFLFLLDSLMMHFIKISFFQEFVISSSGLLSDDNCLVKIIFQSLDLIFHLFAFYVLLRYIFSLNFFAFLQKLIPLLLEVIERIIHFVSDEEITKKHVDLNSLLGRLMGIFEVYLDTEVLICCLVVASRF
jgi:hypothetical protein